MGDAWQDRWGLVFTEAAGSRLSRHAITRRFQRILANAGIPRRRFHDLRHTCATLLLAQGVPLRVVTEILGHSQMATTAEYTATSYRSSWLMQPSEWTQRWLSSHRAVVKTVVKMR